MRLIKEKNEAGIIGTAKPSVAILRALKNSEFLFFNNIIDIKEESDQYYHQPGDMWPDLETFKKMPFDYTIHDPKYEDASLICSKLQTINSEG